MVVNAASQYYAKSYVNKISGLVTVTLRLTPFSRPRRHKARAPAQCIIYKSRWRTQPRRSACREHVHPQNYLIAWLITIGIEARWIDRSHSFVNQLITLLHHHYPGWQWDQQTTAYRVLFVSLRGICRTIVALTLRDEEGVKIVPSLRMGIFGSTISDIPIFFSVSVLPKPQIIRVRTFL